jgi:hypothetical protein
MAEREAAGQPYQQPAEQSSREMNIPEPRRSVERVAQLREIVMIGHTVYTRDGFKKFMTTPMEIFDGKTGKQLLKEGQADRVLKELIADYEGLGY